MKRINIFSTLLVGLLMFGACSDDEPAVVLKPEGITYGTVTDKAGNEYKTLTIGKQTWLAENFRYRPEDATAAEQVTYGELYNENLRVILQGTNQTTYQNFVKNNLEGKKFVLYLREQLMLANEAGELQTTGMYNAQLVINNSEKLPIPYLLSVYAAGFAPIKDKLQEIWDDAVNHTLQVDVEYLKEFGYLYSYEGALKAAKEGAPEGFHLPTDAEWMMLERALGMSVDELEGLENWRGNVGELLKPGKQGIGFDALYGGAAIYATSTQYNPEYVYKNEGAYFWSSDEVFVSDSISNGIVRNISTYQSGVRRMTTRLITSETKVRPSYSVRLVKVED